MPEEVRASVSVDGRRWRRLASAEALAAASPDAHVFILDRESGAVRFGDGKHGRQPPPGSRVRVSYRQGAGASDVTVSWSGQWPPHPFALADALVPRIPADHCN
jgi:hypothetical protein